ncbi:MAG TPA: 6,7-dimethyl-8-ribityllumazine synthase [Firmicutes bacterium]|nr:6,7-dimethyl-8-ribityllumazine synthase [Bacillota bacterium]
MGNMYSAKAVADGLKVAVCASRFNELVVTQLLDGALDALDRHSAGESDADVFWVPGSFELPATAKRLCDTGRYDGVLALGALIRGGTDHYDLLAAEVTKGLANLSMQSAVPVSFGVLTCDTLEQALERAGTKAGNKGADAMVSLIEMVNLSASIENPEE